MKAQSLKASILEAITNVIVGISVAFVSQLVIFNGFGIHVTYLMNLYLTLWFTAVSLGRSFVLRRIFNWFTEHSIEPGEIDRSKYLLTGETPRGLEQVNREAGVYGFEKQPNGTWRATKKVGDRWEACRIKSSSRKGI